MRSRPPRTTVGALFFAIGVAATACGGGDSTPEPSNPSHTGGQSAQRSATSSAAASEPISRERAGQIATQRYGGRVLDVEEDHENGVPTWEVEITDSREGRIEVEVARETGEIVKMEHD